MPSQWTARPHLPLRKWDCSLTLQVPVHSENILPTSARQLHEVSFGPISVTTGHYRYSHKPLKFDWLEASDRKGFLSESIYHEGTPPGWLLTNIFYCMLGEATQSQRCLDTFAAFLTCQSSRKTFHEGALVFLCILSFIAISIQVSNCS